MGMRIHKSGQNNFSGAVNLCNMLAIFPDPDIAQCVFCLADRDNFTAYTKHRAVFDNPQVTQFCVAPGTEPAPRRQREQLSDVDQKKRSVSFTSSQSMISIHNRSQSNAENDRFRMIQFPRSIASFRAEPRVSEPRVALRS